MRCSYFYEVFYEVNMNVGSLVRRKPKVSDWEKHNPWMKTKGNDTKQIGIVVRIGKSGYWDYDVLWSYGIWTHDESELEEVNEN